jgi:pSer/pThr/pTyr-binding forkhead associated (FHA) protein
MDDMQCAGQADDGLTLPGPGADSLRNAGERPAAFRPLRLLLKPGGLVVELNRPEMVVGRHSSSDVRLGLPDVSRRHCRFVFAEGRWQVFDLNSLNGVFVNDERVQQATLEHGDLVRLGGFTFEADLGAVAGSTHAITGPHASILRSIVEVLPVPEQRKAS